MSIEYKLGTRKAVQVQSTEVWFRDEDFDPDPGVLFGTDGEKYLIMLKDNLVPPSRKAIVILEACYWFQEEEQWYWTILKNEESKC